MDATEIVTGHRIVPVVVIEDPAHAVPLAGALMDGGISVIEVTLRTERALDGIEAIANAVPDMLLGVGSVQTPEQMRQAREAGARFAVSPGVTESLLNMAAQLRYPYIPGAITPSEMMALSEHGYTLQKFFPAEAAGGIPMLKSVAGPMAGLRFMPTGGITEALAPEYLALPNVQGIGGTWIAPKDLVAQGAFGEIAERAKAAVA